MGYGSFPHSLRETHQQVIASTPWLLLRSAKVSPELSELKDYLNGCGFEVSAQGLVMGEESRDSTGLYGFHCAFSYQKLGLQSESRIFFYPNPGMRLVNDGE